MEYSRRGMIVRIVAEVLELWVEGEEETDALEMFEVIRMNELLLMMLHDGCKGCWMMNVLLVAEMDHLGFDNVASAAAVDDEVNKNSLLYDDGDSNCSLQMMVDDNFGMKDQEDLAVMGTVRMEMRSDVMRDMDSLIHDLVVVHMMRGPIILLMKMIMMMVVVVEMEMRMKMSKACNT